MLLNFPAAPPGLPGWYQEKQGQWSEPVVCIHLVTGAACKHKHSGRARGSSNEHWQLLGPWLSACTTVVLVSCHRCWAVKAGEGHQAGGMQVHRSFCCPPSVEVEWAWMLCPGAPGTFQPAALCLLPFMALHLAMRMPS